MVINLCRMLLIPKLDSLIHHRDKDTLFASCLLHKLPLIRLHAYIIYFTTVHNCLTELLCTSPTLNQPVPNNIAYGTPSLYICTYSYCQYFWLYNKRGTFKRQFYSACNCVARCQYIVRNPSQHMSLGIITLSKL